MKKPIVVISDTHLHPWSAYSSVNELGINSRLISILDDIRGAARYAKQIGADTILHTGDLFHSRGKIIPSVLNPARALFREIVEQMGVKVVVIGGNHDAQDLHLTALGNAVRSLEDYMEVIDSPKCLDINGHSVLGIPWNPNLQDLKQSIADLNQQYCPDIIALHAGIDGVLSGIPASNSLDPRWLNTLGPLVISGHYHNFRQVQPKVFSVGSLTHQTWKDVGTIPGFLEISPDLEVTHHDSSAPKFIDYSPGQNDGQISGNYVRGIGVFNGDEELGAVETELLQKGALGVKLINTKPKSSSAGQRTSGITQSTTLEDSLTMYVDSTYATDPNLANIKSMSARILERAKQEESRL